jgi:hypothetical protein
MYVLRGRTAGGTFSQPLSLNDMGSYVIVPTNSVWGVDISIVGRSTNNVVFGRFIKGFVANDGGILSGEFFDGETYSSGCVSCGTAVTLNTDNTMRVQVTGSPGANMRWVATIRTTEVKFPAE